uniref:Uncharacterized protein n=1 Tax=viral metagenome TaxID=1070528 RepID=A0A6M3XHN7_9ZZZZ
MAEIISKSETSFIENVNGVRNIAKSIRFCFSDFSSRKDAKRFMKLCKEGIVDKVFIMSELNYGAYTFPFISQKGEAYEASILCQDFLDDLLRLKEQINFDYEKMLNKFEKTENKDIWINHRTNWDLKKEIKKTWRIRKRIGVVTVAEENNNELRDSFV